MTIAVGFFDGVHRGHQAILAGADCALTFENHPLSLLAPERAPRLIMPWREKVQAIQELGVQVTALEFTEEIAKLSPAGFLARLRGFAAGWAARYGLAVDPLVVRCGENWRFGKGGAGDAAWLAAQGVGVEVVPYAVYRGEPISSTRIRRAIEAGAMEDAAAMLGRPFAVRGTVAAGKRLGRTIGYPTINLTLGGGEAAAGALRPPLGVYAVRSLGVRGVANYGYAPTAGESAWREPVLEIHCLEGARPEVAEGAELPVVLLRYLRGERRFASLDELGRQIARDCAEALAVSDPM